MSEKFNVVDRRGGRQEESERSSSLPASLLEETEEVRVTPEKCFVTPGFMKVVVQEDFALSKVGRIIVPDKVKKRPTTGTILKVGKGVEDYIVGEKIIFGLYSGTVLTFKGWDPKTRINFRILNVEEILGSVDYDSPELEGVGV